jgi:hypothetical protein
LSKYLSKSPSVALLGLLPRGVASLVIPSTSKHHRLKHKRGPIPELMVSAEEDRGNLYAPHDILPYDFLFVESLQLPTHELLERRYGHRRVTFEAIEVTDAERHV